MDAVNSSHHRPEALQQPSLTEVSADEDFCRVCRSEGTDADPLFYPCKCSGSIRFVHQECLMEWLKHSQKKHCELCKTPFQFTNLYDPAMPKQLPLHALLRRMAIDTKLGLLLALRWSFVAFVWLCWLPYCTRHIWRSILQIGDHITSNASGHLHDLAISDQLSDISTTNLTDTSILSGDRDTTTTFLPFVMSSFTASDALNRLLVEVFEGQIIASLIIVAFVIVFLIREWIVQNNADLLVESPEFLGTAPVPRDEGRRLQMRLAAEPHVEVNQEPLDNTEDFHSLFQALEARIDAQDSRTAHIGRNTAQSSGTFSNEGSSRADLQSDILDTSDWENLRAQATQTNVRQAMVPGGSSSTLANLQNLQNAAQEAVDARDDTDPSLQEDAMTVAELKAMRRRAVLRATSLRLQQNAAILDSSTEESSGISGLASAKIDSTATSDRQGLDDRLARSEGQQNGLCARRQYRRQRSTERHIWEEAQEWNGESYPDSPMPAPNSNRDLSDIQPLSLSPQEVNQPETALPSSLNYHAGRSTLSATFSSTDFEPTTPAHIEQQNGRVRSNNTTPPLAHNSVHSARSSVALTTDQLDQLLAQVRQAVTPLERTQVTKAAVQVCIDIAQLLRPDLPLNDENPAYREVLQQINTIIRTANEHDMAEEVDIDQLLSNAGDSADVHLGLEPDDVEAEIPTGTAMHHDAPHNEGLVAVEEHPDRDADRAGLDDDIEGLLEVIGVRGPFIALLQNSMLVVVAVAGFITIQIWLPHFFGQCMMAVLRSPKFYFWTLPLNIGHRLLQETTKASNLMARGTSILLRPVIRHSRVYKYSIWLIDYAIHALSPRFSELYAWHTPKLWHTLPELELFSQSSQMLSDRFALSQFQDRIHEYHSFTHSRLVNIVCGYVGLVFFGLLYLRLNIRFTTGEQGKRLELAFRSFLRQSGFVTKFIVILGIELIVFPFYCGVLLDAVLLPLFDHASLAGRLAFATNFPFTSLFIHWLVGTIYMFNFALFVSMCREIVRPGLLFFIRDPNDPAFNPIKDILERPVRSQMRKIGVSVMIYGGLIIGAIGSIVWLLANRAEGLLPLSFGTTEATLEVPFDLLFFQILLPLTYRYVKPHRTIKSIWTQWFIATSKFLRLSSFMMGDRDATQEGRPNSLSIPWLNIKITEENQTFVRDGTYRRVPAVDNLPMRKGKDMIMIVTEDNVLVDGADDDETKDDGDYTLVYAPPQFKLRVYLFLFMMWLFAATLVTSCTIIPLIFGRKIYKIVSASTQINDIFAYLYGVYALGFAVWFLNTTTNLSTKSINLKRILRGNSTASVVSSETMKSCIFTFATWTYLILSFSIVMPALLGIVLESYIIIPMGIWFNPSFTPTVHMMHDWIVGLVYVKIIGRVATMLPASYLGRNINEVVHNDWRNGWRHPDWRLATKRLIFPTVTILVAALTVPLSIGVIARKTVYRNATKEFSTLIYCMSYPAALLSAALIVAAKVFSFFFTQWRGRIRDSLYLKGRRLHNFGEMEVSAPVETRLSANNDDIEVEAVLQELLDHVEDVPIA